MASTKIAYGSVVGFTITLASLADGSARQSTPVDNSTNLFLDAQIQLLLKLASGNIGTDQKINVYFFASMDGTNYDENVGAADAGITIRAPSILRGPFSIFTPLEVGGATTYKAVIPSVAKYFDGVMPYKWGIIVENQTGLAFDVTEANHTKQYRGVYATGT